MSNALRWETTHKKKERDPEDTAEVSILYHEPGGSVLAYVYPWPAETTALMRIGQLGYAAEVVPSALAGPRTPAGKIGFYRTREAALSVIEHLFAERAAVAAMVAARAEEPPSVASIDSYVRTSVSAIIGLAQSEGIDLPVNNPEDAQRLVDMVTTIQTKTIEMLNAYVRQVSEQKPRMV